MPVAPGVPAGWPYGAMTVLVCSIRPSSYVWCPRNSDVSPELPSRLASRRGLGKAAPNGESSHNDPNH